MEYWMRYHDPARSVYSTPNHLTCGSLSVPVADATPLLMIILLHAEMPGLNQTS